MYEYFDFLSYLDWYYRDYSPGQMERMRMYRDEKGNYQFYD